MEWVERLNQSMNYIEEHLTGEIDYEQLGRIACCSTYHYQRMFTYMAGITLAEYIRRRKMSLAAVDLQGGDERIIDTHIKNLRKKLGTVDYIETIRGVGYRIDKEDKE